MTDAAPAKMRVDKWLWQARFFKSRSLAGEMAGSGAMRLNGARIDKPSQNVRPGDVLTFAKAGHVRVIQVDAVGTRRGPATEAATLYTDLSPPEPREPRPPGDARREAGAGRPTKRDRREIDTFKSGRS
ncbi:MAG: RNA-binding S4 domain-containing protein [Pseudomonadota bacterium]